MKLVNNLFNTEIQIYIISIYLKAITFVKWSAKNNSVFTKPDAADVHQSFTWLNIYKAFYRITKRESGRCQYVGKSSFQSLLIFHEWYLLDWPWAFTTGVHRPIFFYTQILTDIFHTENDVWFTDSVSVHLHVSLKKYLNNHLSFKLYI